MDRLLAGLVARDPGAWERLLAEHGGAIERACRRALRGADGAEDAAAEVVRDLLEDDCRLLRRFRPGASLGAYLQVIAYTRTLNRIRPVPPVAAEPEAAVLPDPLEAAERIERLRAALRALPSRDAQALRLFHLEGLGYAEVAQRLGIPAGQVGMVLARARERLRGEMPESP